MALRYRLLLRSFDFAYGFAQDDIPFTFKICLIGKSW